MEFTEKSSKYLLPRLVLYRKTALVWVIQSQLFTEAMHVHSDAASGDTICGLILIPRSVWWPCTLGWYLYRVIEQNRY